MPEVHPEIGASADELASNHGLLLDLAMALTPKRVSLITGLISLIGAGASEKVSKLMRDVEILANDRDPNRTALEHFRHARDILAAVSRLEQSVMTLICGRFRAGFGVMGPVPRVSDPCDVSESVAV